MESRDEDSDRCSSRGSSVKKNSKHDNRSFNLDGPFSSGSTGLPDYSDLGFSYAAAASGLSPAGFSLLGAPGLFPGMLPFGGLGAPLLPSVSSEKLSRGYSSPTITSTKTTTSSSHSSVSASSSGGMLDSDWWKIASEQARQLAEYSGSSLFPGMNGAASSLFSPFFGMGVPGLPVITTQSSSSSPSSKSTTVTTSSSSRKGAASPGARSKDDKKQSGKHSSSTPRGSSNSRRGLPDSTPSSSYNNSDFSLENSLLSAEAAMYSAAAASSPFFFPFGIPPPGAFGMMPGFPPGIPSFLSGISPPSTTGSFTGSTFSSPMISSMFSNHTTGGNRSPKSTPDSVRGSRSRTPVDSPAGWQKGGKSQGNSGSAKKREASGVGSRSTVSPASSSSSARTVGLTESRSNQRTGSTGPYRNGDSVHSRHQRSLSREDDLGADPQSRHYSPYQGLDRPPTLSPAPVKRDTPPVSYSDDGAIDLSVKKPRKDSGTSSTKPSSQRKKSSTDSKYGSNLSSASQSRQQALEAQLQQMAAVAAAGMPSDPLSLSLAAALLPQMYESLGAAAGFYPSSALAAMAAAAAAGSSGAQRSGSPTGSRQADAGSRESSGSRSRGRRRGNGTRTRNRSTSSGSSGFISNLMGYGLESKGEKYEEGLKGRGGGRNAGRGSRGERNRGKLVSSMLHESEERHEKMRQALQADLDQNSARYLNPSQDFDSYYDADPSKPQRETLSSKLQHHQNKLAQSLLPEGQGARPPKNLPSDYKKDLGLNYRDGFKGRDGNKDLRDFTNNSLVRAEYDDCSSNDSWGAEDDWTDRRAGEQTNSATSSDTDSTSLKRGASDSYGEPQAKRRKVKALDGLELKKPMECGWHRETYVEAFERLRVRGVIKYISPKGQIITSRDTLDQYLKKELKINDDVGDVSKQAPSGERELSHENFSFSTRCCLGKFYEKEECSEKFALMNDDDVLARYMLIAAQRQRAAEKRERDRLQSSGQAATFGPREVHKFATEYRLQQKEQARKEAEIKQKKKEEKQQQKEEQNKARQIKAIQIHEQKEKQKQAKLQEKTNRQQQEQEARRQLTIKEQGTSAWISPISLPLSSSSKTAGGSLLVSTCSSLSLLSSAASSCVTTTAQQPDMQYYSYLLHAAHQRQLQEQQLQKLQKQKEEQDKHKQILSVVSLERERKRQQILLVKAIEARKREEEKEKVKEEKKSAKKVDKEKKAEQKRVEMYLMRELRKPMEDMCLSDSKDLPHIDRIPGVRLPGKAFGDALMILEFVHNFSSTIGFDNDSLPSLNLLQNGLLNLDLSDTTDQFNLFLIRLLKAVLKDPGISNPKDAVTVDGRKVAEVELNEGNVSEIMRIYLKSKCGRDDEMTEWLRTRPFRALNSTQKASVLRFFCNELLSSKPVMSEIEKNMETMTNLRRDRWLDEGKLRKLRMIQAKRFRGKHAVKPQPPSADESSNTTTNASMPPATGSEDRRRKKPAVVVAASEDDSESSSDEENTTSTVTQEQQDSDIEEDHNITSDELDTKIEKIIKMQHSMREKVFNISHRLSAMSLGQDRWRRRYWILPKCSGVFVEGLESGEPESEDPNGPDITAENDAKKEDEKEEVKEEVKEVVTSPSKKRKNSPVKDSDKKVNGTSDDSEKPAVEAHGKGGDTLMKDAVEMNGEHGKDSEVSVGMDGNSGNGHENVISNKIEATGTAGQMNCHGSQLGLVNGEATLKDEICTNDDVSKLTKIDGKDIIEFKSEIKSESGLKSGIKIENLMEKEVKWLGDKCPDLKSNLLAESKSQFDDGKVMPVLERQMMEAEENILENSNKASETLNRSKLSTSLAGETNIEKDSLVNSQLTAVTSHQLDSLSLSSNVLSSSSQLSVTTSSLTPLTLSSAMMTSTSSLSNRVIKPLLSPETAQLLSQQNLNMATQRGIWFSILPRISCETETNPASESLADKSTDSITESNIECGTPATPMSASQSKVTMKIASLVSSVVNFNGLKVKDDDWITLDLDSANQEEICQLPFVPDLLPLDKQRGWWRITSAEKVKDLLASLNTRGIREGNLHKSLARHLEYACQACSKGKKNIFKLDVTEESKSFLTGRHITCPPSDDVTGWDHETQREIELELLDEVEDIEERVCSANLQGWKMSPKASEDDSIKFVCSDKKELEPDERYIIETAKEKLLYLEHNIERRYLKPPLGKNNKLDLSSLSAANTSSTNHRSTSTAAAAAASAAASQLEAESAKKDDDNEKDDDEDDDDDDDDDDEESMTKELIQWRAAVEEATSAAQLSMYLEQLNKSIAWEKSIMKVTCQICCEDDNEAELLLCDLCDRGYHTYCVRPKLEGIPAGDWFCHECIAKASNEVCCVVCGRVGGRLTVCDVCQRRAHTDCLIPPLNRMPKKWTCNACTYEKNREKTKKSRDKAAVQEVEPEESPSALEKPEKPSLKDLKEDSVDRKSESESLGPNTPSSSDTITSQPPEDIKIPARSPAKRKSPKKPKGGKRQSAAEEEGSEEPGCLEEKKGGEDGKEETEVQESIKIKISSQKVEAEKEVPKVKSGRKGKHHHHRSRHHNNEEEVGEEMDVKNSVQGGSDVEENEGEEGNEAAECNGVKEKDDMEICREILEDLRKHDDAWPFLTPVSSKQFPNYRRIIRTPIDFQTMAKKLNSNKYKSRDDFSSDALLVFSNCEKYNEDNSSIGRAGLNMKMFFNQCWQRFNTDR